VIAQAKLQKMLKILVTLNCKYGRTLQEICDQFDISERTAYRYIETIRDVGFVIDKRENYSQQLFQ
jgi:predicted DNA-binding transcriptional regulator YafY